MYSQTILNIQFCVERLLADFFLERFSKRCIYAPYDWNKIISDLREVGEKEYGMIWEESLWVKNRGMDYGSKFDDEYGYDIIDGHHKGCASYGFPVANTDNYDGEDFRNA